MTKAIGRMLVMFGAIAIRFVNHEYEAQIVPGSLLMWDPTHKSTNGRVTAARVTAARALWNILDQTNVAPDQHNYHGNFNADLFETLFKRLCDNLQSFYGPCVIHMDGAAYHKRNTCDAPKSSEQKAERPKSKLG